MSARELVAAPAARFIAAARVSGPADLLAAAGALLVALGAREIFRPLGLIVGGLFLLWLAVGEARRRASRSEQ